MNVLTRGVKNTLRSPVRSGAIILIFAISISLIVSMLVARSSVLAKINEVKATAGTSVTVRPAGTMGGMGGGDPLTSDQLNKIKSTTHVKSMTMTLTDQLSTDNTTLKPSLQFGSFGHGGRENSSGEISTLPSSAPTPAIIVTGTNNIDSVAADGGTLTITSGNTISASSNENIALMGSALAEKNNLKVGDTFTAYGKTVTLKGIYTTENSFQDSGFIMPLASLQLLTEQPNVVSSVVATVDSSDNVKTTVAALKSSLGSDADITSEVQKAEQSVSSLESIASLALAGVIAAAIAGATTVLLSMIMVVRERRREIGVMKAIGGTDTKVVGQFIIEGLTLTMFGAAIGMLLGLLVSGPMTTSLVSNQASNPSTTQAIPRDDTATAVPSGGPAAFAQGGARQLQNNITQVTASLTPEIMAIALGVTIFISLIGTAIPAWFTARVRPAEVLRTE